MTANSPFRVLVVEDEILIALGLELLAEDAGFDPVGIATTAEDALTLAHRTRPDIALVDIHLADGPTGIDVARTLAARGTTVVFVTANLKRIPEDFAGACGTITKPHAERSVREALSFLADLLDGACSPDLPDGLIPSPRFRTRVARRAPEARRADGLRREVGARA